MSSSPVVESPVLWHRADGVATLTLNRPDRLNAWTPELGARYFELLDRAAGDEEVRVIVVTGAGRGFCAGADMDVLDAIDADAPPTPDPRPHSYTRTLGKPVIAAVNGACAGAGLVAALMCDVRFAAAEAKFTTAFARRGLVAEYGSAWVLARIVGASRALDLLLSGRTIVGTEAYELGLVDRVHPRDELVDATLAYAKELAAYCSPWSMSVIKQQVYAGLETNLVGAERLADRLMRESFGRPDLAEGVASYTERRPPRFPPLEDGH